MPISDSLIDRFLLPEPYSMARKAEAYDCIVPQAYGRNTFPDEELSLIWKKRSGLGSDIETFEWLRSDGFDPGRPNRFLATACYRAATGNPKHRVAVIGQWEVMYALWEAYPEWYLSASDSLVSLWPSETGSQKTYGLFLDAKRVCDQLNLTTPLIPAVPQHAPRTFFLAKKVFGVTPAVPERHPNEDPTLWYAPYSVQWWTRSERLWLIYESLARIHHKLLGRL